MSVSASSSAAFSETKDNVISEDSSSSFPVLYIGIIAGVGGFLVLVAIVIIIVAIVVKKRKSNLKKFMDGYF